MYYIGVDLGGTNIAVGLVDEDFKLVAKQSIPTEVKNGVQSIIDRMAGLINKVVSDATLTMKDIAWIGIGSPGVVVPEKQEIGFAPNLGFLHTPVGPMLQEHFPDTKIFLGNDADVAAFGEAKAGAAKGTSSSVTITLGTGVGGGMIIDGKIYNGFNHAGGELGHIAIHEGDRPCTCGRNGCWEAYASVTGLIQTTKESMEKNPDSKMWEIAEGNLDNVNGLTSFDAMRAGDKAAKEVVDSYITSVASGLVSILNVLQPEIICIGGGISKEGDTLLKPIQEYAKTRLFSRHVETQSKIAIAKLGNDAGIIGAALLGSME